MYTHPQIAKSLNCVTLECSYLKDCSIACIDRISEKKNIHVFQKDELIFEEGQRIGGIFCVFSGNIKITRKDRKQKEYIISLAKSGDLLGVHSAIHDLNYSNSARAMEHTVGCFIPKDVFMHIMKSNPLIFLNVMKQICWNIDKVEKRFSEISHKTAAKRLANGLLLLRDTFGLDNRKTIKISLQSVNIPSLVIASEATTNKILKEFEKLCLIRIQKNKIQLKDIEGIKQFANQNYS